MAKFIVFEGNDCSGKTTSIEILSEFLNSQNVPHFKIKFPDRKGVHGDKIDKYLKKEIELTNEEAYKMFKENREPYEQIIKNKLSEGITVICDRYLYSGIVYSYYNLYQNTNITKEYVDQLINNEAYMPKPDLIYLINGYHPRNDTLERYEQPNTIMDMQILFKKLYELININYKIIDNNSTFKYTHEQIITCYLLL